MTTSIHNIQKISLLFFILIGIFNLSTGALFSGNETNSVAKIIYYTTFIPFIICALIYAGSSLKINIINYGGNDSKALNYSFIGGGLVITIAISIIFFLLPSL